MRVLFDVFARQSHKSRFTKWQVSTRMQKKKKMSGTFAPSFRWRSTTRKVLQAGRQSCCSRVGGSLLLFVLQGHKWIWGNQEICGHKVSATLSTLPSLSALIIPDNYLQVCTDANSSRSSLIGYQYIYRGCQISVVHVQLTPRVPTHPVNLMSFLSFSSLSHCSFSLNASHTLHSSNTTLEKQSLKLPSLINSLFSFM